MRVAVHQQAASNGNGAVAAKKPAPKGPAAPAGPFTNINRFKVEPQSVALFEGVWREREAAMQSFPGFQGFKLTNDGDQWVAQQTWATIPEWEAWSLSDPARRTHLPLGVWQHVPAKGEGFPEDFVFLLDYNEPVNAKY
ncbi:hypothetical protein MNEG_6470 [Monoraphidium neglectum]|uniref:ABM domain-containing protein n=1 Tax=Monoraphidium neglectum TaxID=145388 RepID=A0A0D2MEB3_9CHLO|nr:hypothetical protein MNEG_6470 [Monoraphidium neglectum]KIZ01495.1 hypothetical protein MNEG_6470 [Monoraphidium neglectum]|eukprot:XP_013900514.1 hypothetical protein MNEG_6470 [Monoraphidium neglectum]